MNEDTVKVVEKNGQTQATGYDRTNNLENCE